MTKKEKLYLTYLQYTNLATQTCPENGGQVKDFEKCMSRFSGRDYTVCDLESMVDASKKKYEQALKDRKRIDYYNTPEGKIYKDSLEGKLEAIMLEIENLFKKYESKITDFITNICEDIVVKISSFSTTSFRVDMVDEDGKQIFGHGLDINRGWGENCYTLNYGCMGSFNPLTDTYRVKLLRLFSLMSNPNNFKTITELMLKFSDELKVLRKTHTELSEQLKYPEVA